MGTRPPRGRHSEVALTTTDDGAKADWPAGGQTPWIPQEEEEEETATEKEASEETKTEKAAVEETKTEKVAVEETKTEKATSKKKGGDNGGEGEPRNPRDNTEDGGRPCGPGTWDDEARESGVASEPEETREQRENHHRASHGPGGSWLWKEEEKEETATEKEASEETKTEKAAVEETKTEKVAVEETKTEKATSKKKGGDNGGEGEPRNPRDNTEDGGRPCGPGTWDDEARESGVASEPEETREQRENHHRASHGPGGSWLWKVRSLWANRGAN
ncbi:hypothetical protein NDU88_005667 [Pleurodeles waltl]|uniref:Uncharacterized protein n=1 Tax=Pleurodeles waltl TaxID=8319 RepID=A0AAV7UJL7_PLEWA|nr:hypothetical protein NDU88_005667 [Pleurodeles waltl]